MPSPEFQLLPWERGVHPVKPSQPITVLVEGHSRRFDVKTYNGLVYFRFADEEKHDDRIWTLLSPAPESNLEAFFQVEVEASRVARFFCIERGFSTRTVPPESKPELNAYIHPSTLCAIPATSLAVAVCDNGTAFTQEWCGGPWFEFSLPSRPAQSGAHCPSIWHRGWNAPRLQRTLSTLTAQIAFRPFTVDLEKQEYLRFVCGSFEQLKALFRAACIHFMPVFELRQEQHPYWKSNRASQSVRCSLILPIRNQQTTSDDDYMGMNDFIPHDFLTLFSTHQIPTGGMWYSRQRDRSNRTPPTDSKSNPETTKRIDFGYNPNSLNVQLDIPRQPSSHESLESYLLLRNWLQSIGEEQRIPELLSL